MISKVNSPCGGNAGWSTSLWWDDAVIVFGLALIIPIDVSSVLRKSTLISYAIHMLTLISQQARNRHRRLDFTIREYYKDTQGMLPYVEERYSKLTTTDLDCW